MISIFVNLISKVPIISAAGLHLNHLLTFDGSNVIEDGIIVLNGRKNIQGDFLKPDEFCFLIAPKANKYNEVS